MTQGQEVLYHLDAGTFQTQLGELAETLAFKVQREGRQRLPQPDFVIADLFVLLRQASYTDHFFFFLNADERRENDLGWRVPYSVVSLPLIRCMIDCLYNVTAILANPAQKAYQFRESGYRRALEALDADQARYGGDPKWDAYIAQQRANFGFLIRRDGFEIAAKNIFVYWGSSRITVTGPSKPEGSSGELAL